MSVRTIRNLSFCPVIDKEGYFDPPLPAPSKLPVGAIWYKNLNPNHRLYYHQTLNSVRKNHRFHQYTQCVPKDSLDFLLQSRYNQTEESFADKLDCFLQPETVGWNTFRLLRNRKNLRPIKIEHLGHPLTIGGTKEKISPHSVKLINSGHHTQLTNNGYSRQSADGNFFHY